MNVVILHERARRFEATAERPWMSLKCMLTGSARYRVGRRELEVGHGQCLLLNTGTAYSIEIQSREPVESFVVFFATDWIGDVLHAYLHRDGRLLDEPFAGTESAFHFEETLYPMAGDLARVHERLRRSKYSGDSPEQLEEVAGELIGACVCTQSGIAVATQQVRALRAATRNELYRRLLVAREFLLSHYAAKISLHDVARAACLSPFHLARQFKTAFGVAPMTYLRSVRLERAIALLCETDRTVLEVCLDVGFESPTTFAVLLKRTTGMSPREMRRILN